MSRTLSKNALNAGALTGEIIAIPDKVFSPTGSDKKAQGRAQRRPGILDAFLVFGPPHLNEQTKSVELNGFTCHIAGMWPMYSTEIEIYNEMGLEKFWHHEGWDPMNVKRRPITTGDG